MEDVPRARTGRQRSVERAQKSLYRVVEWREPTRTARALALPFMQN